MAKLSSLELHLHSETASERPGEESWGAFIHVASLRPHLSVRWEEAVHSLSAGGQSRATDIWKRLKCTDVIKGVGDTSSRKASEETLG